jgi:uncharacterized protein YaaQ
MNKLILAIVPRDQAGQVINELVTAGYTATFTESRGGVLRQAQQMLFIVVDAAKLDAALAIIRENCRTAVQMQAHNATAGGHPSPVTVDLGGAVVFTWDLERFETF